MIYLFHDITKRLDLERRYDAMLKVQGETLDNLTEAVAVFAQRRAAAAVQSRLRAHVEARPGERCTSIRISRR